MSIELRLQLNLHCWLIPDTSGMNTGHVRYEYRTRPVLPDQQENQLALLSLKYSKLTWVGLSTYETLSINMMHPS